MFEALISSVSDVLGGDLPSIGGAFPELPGMERTETISPRVDVTQTAGGGPMIQKGDEFPIWIVVGAVAVIAVVLLRSK